MIGAEDATLKTADSAASQTAISAAPPASSRRAVVLKGLLIFALALAVRVAFFSIQSTDIRQVWRDDLPFGQSEMGDIAVNLAQGRGFSSPFGMGSTPTAWLCPLIPFLWAGIIKVLGSANGHTALVIAYTGTIPSAACAVAYWLIARHMLRGQSMFRRTLLLVAVIFCLWPEACYELGYLWYYPWQELATALVVLSGVKWIDRPSLKSVASLGIAAGILALINVAPMPIFAVILLLPVLQNRTGRKRIFGYATVGAGLALLIVLPWLVRDAVVLHAFVPLRSNAGFQLWEGNNPDGCIREDENSRHPMNKVEELERYQKLGEVAYNRQAFHDALIYMRAHPLETGIRIGQRAYVFWLTDTFDQWKWNKSTARWWHRGRPKVLKSLSATIPAWGTVGLLIWALLSGRLAALPYKWLFAGILFFLPFPYYFTLADPQYSQILRSWLLLLTIFAFSGAFRRNSGRATLLKSGGAGARGRELPTRSRVLNFNETRIAD